MINIVTFPGLGLEFSLNRVAFHIGSWRCTSAPGGRPGLASCPTTFWT